mgnify:CR=1 FL=1
MKTTDERHLIPTDDVNPKWAYLGDRGYQGQDSDTLEVRRTFVKRNANTPGERRTNETLSQIRVPVEQFFGRLVKLWAIMKGTYRYDRVNFDSDYDNCVLLTNEHIKANNLEESDLRLYRAFLQQRKEAEEKRQQKRQVDRDRRRRQLGW